MTHRNLGICLVAGPLLVLMSGSRSVAAFLIPPIICFILFLSLAIYSYKMSMSVSQLVNEDEGTEKMRK